MSLTLRKRALVGGALHQGWVDVVLRCDWRGNAGGGIYYPSWILFVGLKLDRLSGRKPGPPRPGFPLTFSGGPLGGGNYVFDNKP